MPRHYRQRVDITEAGAGLVRQNLDNLRAQQAELAHTGDEAAATPAAADLAAVADRLDKVLAQGEPEQNKALLRILIAELRVNSKTDIQPIYRIVARVCATSKKVETAGLTGSKP